MVKRIGGNRRKTRNTFKKDKRTKGKISITRFFQEFKTGDKVLLNAEPAVQKGMPFRRFQGKAGIVQKKTRTCYEVAIKDGKVNKIVIVHPVHLKSMQELKNV